jgi:hypothetical protein
MGTCTEVSVQAAQIGCLDADFRQHVRPADIELRVIPSRSISREAGRVSSDSSHPGAMNQGCAYAAGFYSPSPYLWA